MTTIQKIAPQSVSFTANSTVLAKTETVHSEEESQKKKKQLLAVLGGLAVLGTVAAGITLSMKKGKGADAGEKAEEAAREAGEKLGDAGEKANEAIQEAAQNIGNKKPKTAQNASKINTNNRYDSIPYEKTKKSYQANIDKLDSIDKKISQTKEEIEKIDRQALEAQKELSENMLKHCNDSYRNHFYHEELEKAQKGLDDLDALEKELSETKETKEKVQKMLKDIKNSKHYETLKNDPERLSDKKTIDTEKTRNARKQAKAKKATKNVQQNRIREEAKIRTLEETKKIKEAKTTNDRITSQVTGRKFKNGKAQTSHSAQDSASVFFSSEGIKETERILQQTQEEKVRKESTDIVEAVIDFGKSVFDKIFKK